MKTVSLM